MGEDNNSFFEPPQKAQMPVPAPTGDGKRNNAYKWLTIGMIVVAVVLVMVFFALVNDGYRIKNIVVNGSSPYAKDVLVEIADTYCDGKSKRSFFYVDPGELENELVAKLPYLKNVSVEKKSPDTLIINVEGEEAACFFSMFGRYYTVNSEMKVLEISDTAPASPTFIELTIAVPKEIVLGKPLEFDGGLAVDSSSFLKLFKAIEESSLRYDVISINAENKFEMTMKLRSGADVKLGSIRDIEEKISGLKKWLDENTGMLGPKVNIDVSILKKISITYD